MRYLLVVLIFSFLVQSCDDGDIITVELAFDQELELCDTNTESFILFDTKTDPDEALILVLPRTSADSLVFFPNENPQSLTRNINGSTYQFIYRTFNQEPQLCNTIEDPNTVVLENYEANSGELMFQTSFVDDDNDGIPSENEGFNAQNPELSTDTDMDGIPNYIDQDDDNDNIPTVDEDDNDDGDNNPATNPRDTDGDGIPDYLEEDDDNDGTLTRFEDENGDGPQNGDVVDTSDPMSLPRYREPSVSDAFDGAALLNNTFSRVTEVTITVLNAGLEIINADVINFGTYTFTEQNPE